MDFEKKERWLRNNRGGVAGTSLPARAKHFIAQSSDLHGSTNPTGILSPHFLRLKLALDRGADPDEILQALYNWIPNKTSMGATPSDDNIRDQVAKILELPTPEEAYDSLVELIGGKLKPRGLPKLVQQTLRKVVGRVAQHAAERTDYEGSLAKGRAQTIRQRFADESADQLVGKLLDS